jgi:hypothetical protein
VILMENGTERAPAFTLKYFDYTKKDKTNATYVRIHTGSRSARTGTSCNPEYCSCTTNVYLHVQWEMYTGVCIRDDDDRSCDKDGKNASATIVGSDPSSPILVPLQEQQTLRGLSDVPSYYTGRHQNALLVELSILETLLRRNSDAHAKTKYFRHSTCTLHRVLNQPHAVPKMYTECVNMMEQFDAVTQKLRRKTSKDISTTDSDLNTFLELKTLVVDMTEGGSSILFSRASSGLTECRQRIEATYRHCRQEIQRGFFLPLITIIAACWARIYTIFVRLQTFTLQIYVHQCCQLSNILLQSTNSTTTKEINTQKRHLSERIYLLKEKCMEILSNLPKESLWHSPGNALYPSTGRNRMERTEQALRFLGLQFPNVKITPAKDPNLSRNSIESSAQLNSQTPEVNDTYVSITKSLDPNNSMRENDDLGERFLNHLQLPTASNHDTSLATVSYASVPSMNVDQRIEQNDIIVEQFQKKKKKRTYEKVRSTSTSAKKKKREPDFFDQLFK